MNHMSYEEHKDRHILLHRKLDELLADWIRQEPTASIDRPLADLMEWSHGQTQDPTEDKRA